MKKLILILFVLFTGNATFAQATSSAVTDKNATANHGKTVSAAAQTSVTAETNLDAASKGEYVSTVARSKKEATLEKKEQAKEAALTKKEAAKAKANDASEATMSSEANVISSTQANQGASLEDGSLASEGALSGSLSAQGKGQDKVKSDKKDGSKDKATDKTKKELDNHGQKVKATAQGVLEGSKEKGQEVKEVASAKRQQKPEKVETDANVTVEVKAPKSAARPGRGAAKAVQGTTNAATKTVGNAAKAVKPVKVGGKVGVGSVIKVGKN